jgi:hypothetical protein
VNCVLLGCRTQCAYEIDVTDPPKVTRVQEQDGRAWSPSGMTAFDAEAFGSHLYFGTGAWDGSGEVWRSADGTEWEPVVTGGLGDPYNGRPYGLIAFDGHLYLVFCNVITGAEVWRSNNGTTWEQVADAGWGDTNNSYADYFDKAAAVFSDRLYIGTFNSANGGDIWKKTVTADVTARPTHGAPPLPVTFTNLSAGDYTTSLWDFGDGATSTEANPTHTFAVGVYGVTLTVGDGVDTSTITRTAYIRALHPVYLPLLMRNH